ncbi:MAG: AraC family transcriptional regulator [Betaproteobacteria bacterium]|nr:AraC family transcriptional regulator [Betaproteobacteria bacterium]
MTMKTLTRETYAKRIERVADYLIDHLDGDVDLHRLAEEAFLSPYHFHRVYHGMTGETVAETVRRLRLHRAAVKLISSDIAIATLAEEAGYGSVQAFNRAFSQNYAMPPAAYREKQSRTALRAPAHTSQEKNMYPVTIKEVAPVRVAALRHEGEYMEIGAAFERLNIWAAGQGLLDTGVRWFGIYHDDPAAPPKGNVKNLRSDACVAIPSSVTPPDDYRTIDTPSGRCAMLVYTGPYSSLEKPYSWLFGEWLPNSGEEPADQPCFEEYLNDARSVPPSELITAIYLPLKG